MTRSYDAAIARLKILVAAADVGSDLGEYAAMLGDVQTLAGDSAGAQASYEMARVALEKELKSAPENEFFVDRLARTHAGLGHRALALALQRRAVTLLLSTRDAYVGPIYEEDLARLQARFGETDAAITSLQHLVSIPYGYPPITAALLRLDPDWDSLRGDPRFAALVSR